MEGLDFYKEFVDRCVDLLGKKYGGCINARCMREKKRMHDDSATSKYNVFFDILSDEQLELLAEYLDNTFQAAIHDFLAMFYDNYLNDDNIKLIKANNDVELRLPDNCIEMPVDPFDTEIYYDFICRCSGDNWPEQ